MEQKRNEGRENIKKERRNHRHGRIKRKEKQNNGRNNCGKERGRREKE